MDFWKKFDELIKSSKIVIDRKQGTSHPRFPELIYPLDYGYLQDTNSNDGNEIDIWRGSLTGQNLVGVICTVDTLKRDSEIKLLLNCTTEELEIIENFHNSSDHMSGLLIKR